MTEKKRGHVYSSHKVMKSTSMERIVHAPWREEDLMHALAQVGWMLSTVKVTPLVWPVPAHQDVELLYLVEFTYLGCTHNEVARGQADTLSGAMSKAIAMATLTDEQRRGDVYYPVDDYGHNVSIEDDPPPEE